MCFASCGLSFGITVKITDLCLLGTARAKIEPALRAVDLILARRRQGRLETAGAAIGRDVRAVPVEVWTMIKTELVKEALADECLKHFKRHGPRRGCECWDELHLPRLVPPCAGSFDFELAVRSCEIAFELFSERGGVEDLTDSSENLVSQLLESFDLRLVSSPPLSKSESDWTNLDASWAITVTSSASSRPHNHTAVEIDHDFPCTHGLAHLPASALELPPDARARFARLLATFPWLEPTRLGSPVDPKPPSRWAGRPEWEHMSAKERSEATHQARPELFTSPQDEQTGRRGCGKPRGNSFEFEFAVGLCVEVPEVARSNEELLKRFGLCLADPTPLARRGNPLDDFDASWAVTFSSSRSAHMQNSATVDVEPDLTSTHGLAHLPPSTFDIPPDARARFARLLSTFPWLEPTRLPGTSDPPSPPSTAWGPTTAHLPEEERWVMGRREMSARRRDEQRIGREPGWMLLNVAA